MNQQNKQIINQQNQPVNNQPKPSFSNNVAENVTNDISNMYDKTNNVISLSSGFLVALAVNEVVKVYINRSIKFNRGSTTYYIYYALVAILIAAAVNTYKRK